MVVPCRADQIVRGITTREGQCTAATAAAATTFQHITVTSFMPAGGSDDAALPVGVIVPFRNVHEDFRKIWPEALFWSHKVLEDRFAEVFLSKRSGAGNVGSPKSKAAVALDLLDVVSPSRRRCDVDGCKGMVATTDRFCSKCGAPNSSYDAETAKLFQSGRKAGWHKAAKVQVVPETEAEHQLARGVGDLLDAIRKRIPETSTTSVPHEAAAAPEAKDSGAQGSKAMESDASFKKSKTVPQPLPPPAAGAADDEDEDMEASVEPEWDLSKLAHCQQYIEEHFPASEAAAAGVSVAGFGRIVCFFLGELRARKGGLAHWFTKEVLSCGMLKTKASRAAWLQAWKAQRGKTFLPKSKPKRGRSGCKVCISCRFQGMGFAKP